MKKTYILYGALWLLLLSILFSLITSHNIFFEFGNLWNSWEVPFGISLILSNQIIGFLCLYRQIRSLQKKNDPPQDKVPEE